ncbi:hypothetical protein K523DRAFT_297138 [Schizophyllum commune Tattone D]|nr:hypothetical protein K523DRAFT_297138 [Schizophyllum commune Tattone D]
MSPSNPSVCPKNAKVTQRGAPHDASVGRLDKGEPMPAQSEAFRAYCRVDRRARKRTRSQGGASQSDVASAKRQNRGQLNKSVIQKPTPNAKHAIEKSGDVVFKPKPGVGDAATTSIERDNGGAPGLTSMARPRVIPMNVQRTSAPVPPNARSADAPPAAAKPEGLEAEPASSSNGPSHHATDEPFESPLNEPARKLLDSLLSIKPTQGDLALQAKREEPAKRRALERKRSTYVAGDDDSKLNASNKQYGYSFIHDDRGLMKRV